MANIFYPDMHADSVFDISTKSLEEKGIKNIIIDIDNTLSSWGSRQPEPGVCQWISSLTKQGFRICILSNSSNKRIRYYCSNIDVLFAENVRKPLKSSFIKAMRLLNSSEANTCVIGDQVFTDIMGGNLCGLYTILVSPIGEKEFVFTKIMRKFQSRILKDYFKRH